MKAPQYHKFWCFSKKLPHDISLLCWYFPFSKSYEKLLPLKGWIKKKIRVPSNLENSIVLSKMSTVFYSIHNPLFSALNGFHTFRNESPSRGARSPTLVLRGFHDFGLISFAALCPVPPPLNELGPRNSKIGWLFYIIAPFPHMMVVSMFEEEIVFCTISL